MTTSTAPPPSRPWRLVGVLAVALALLLGMTGPPPPATAQTDAPASEPASIHPDLLAEVEGPQADSDEPLEALLVLEATADLPAVQGDPRAVAAELQQVAAESQEVVVEELEVALGDAATVRNGLWIINALLVELPREPGALDQVASLSGVQRVSPNFTLEAIRPATDDASAATVEDRTYGIDTIGAHRVWDELGLDGSGVRVATLDTGVDIDHPDLAGKMTTDDASDPTYPGGWMEFDSAGNLVSGEPRDSSDHGTHVSGTIHGGDESDVHIGVAPGADMMHGLVIPGGSGAFTQVAAGMQWAIDPTDADGNQVGEPAHVVNMSLGAAGYVAEMIAPTRAMEAAGIFPSFSIGNANLFGNCGPGRPIGSGSPGNVYEAVGVGATDVNDDVAAFSCGETVDTAAYWGADAPSDWPAEYVKPDISAPGVATLSALPGGGYGQKSGTSMAAPHVAGTAALMLSAAPELTVSQTLDTMADTAFFDDRYGAERPNSRYGNGRVDAYEATVLVALDSGITGTVVDDDDDAPVAGATVTVEQTGASVRTGDDGAFAVRLEPGTYDLTAEAFAYEPTTLEDVTVTEDAFTDVTMTLTPAPTGSIAGTVSFADSGVGIPGARVSVDGAPLSATTGADGSYQIDGAPEGTHTVRVTTDDFVQADPVVVTVVAGETATADFALEAVTGDIGLITSSPARFVNYLTGLGLEPSVYGYADLEAAGAAGHDTYLVGYHATAPNLDAFSAFVDATDANGSGVLFLDHAFGTWNGIPALSAATGQPEETGGSSAPGGSPSYYEVVAEHPILDGFEVGDQIEHEPGLAAWIGWFSGYTGEGRQVIADMGRTDDTGVYGSGIGVDERDDNRHVLLSSHSSSATRGPTEWSEDSETVFWNAVDWASPDPDPDQPRFVTWDLEVSPEVVEANEPVDVDVQVTNVGGAAGDHVVTLTVDGDAEDTATVTLDPGETTEVSWQVSRGEIGTYTVAVGNESDTFRVRGPNVTIDVATLTGAGQEPGPMEGASVELVHDGDIMPVGTTDADGTVAFEAPFADSDVTVVVRRGATDDHPLGYLLQRPERINADGTITLRPRTLAEGPGEQAAWNQSAILDLQVEPVADTHQAWTYLRSDLTAPHGFAVEPGPVVATIGTYEARHVHAITELERDWWYASDIVAPDLQDPTDVVHTFGGPAEATLEVTSGEGTQFTADWAVSDGNGLPFTIAATTDLRPFAEAPAWQVLEDIPGWVSGLSPNDAEVLLRLLDPDGTPVHAGGVGWDERSVTRDLADLVDEVVPGTYTLRLEAQVGAWGDDVEAEASIAGAPSRTLPADAVPAGGSFDVTVAFTATADGGMTLTEQIAPAGAGAEDIGNGWPVTGWDASADGSYDDDGTWTFPDVAAGEDVTVTYTVASPLNVVTPSDWELSGHVTELDSGSTHTVAGDQTLSLVGRSSDVGRRPVDPGDGSRVGPIQD